MEKLFIIILTIFIGACGPEFRSPICKEGEKHIPKSFEGTYRVTIPQMSSASNEPYVLNESIVRLSPNQVSGNVTLLKAIKANDPGFPVLGGGICVVDGHYYLEAQSDNGTTQLYEVVPEANGLSLLTVTFDTKILKTNNIPYFLLPQVSDNDGKERSSSPFDSGSTLIIDNRSIDRSRLLSYSRRLSLAYQFTKIDGQVKSDKNLVKIFDVK